jgi:hypothetical protein
MSVDINFKIKLLFEQEKLLTENAFTWSVYSKYLIENKIKHLF